MISFVYFWGAAQTKQYYLSLRSLPLVVQNSFVRKKKNKKIIPLFYVRFLYTTFVWEKGISEKFLVHLGGFLGRMMEKEVKICSKDKNGAGFMRQKKKNLPLNDE